jgi:hypothetical protein
VEDFKLVENKKFPDKTAIELVGGDFKGMIYLYGDVTISEEDPPVLGFDFEVMKNPNKVKYKDSKAFEDVMGDILVGLIDEQMKKYDRKDDTDELSNE